MNNDDTPYIPYIPQKYNYIIKPVEKSIRLSHFS